MRLGENMPKTEIATRPIAQRVQQAAAKIGPLKNRPTGPKSGSESPNPKVALG
jgi:hypothetical protein